jgi:hypothetical protein
MVRCTFCSGEFLATTKPVDVVRLKTGCSVTRQLYTWVLQRDVDQMYRLVHLMASVATIRDGGAEPMVKTRSIDVTKFDLSNVQCPGCVNTGIDFCSCGSWVCQGAARHVSGGRRNLCPTCHKDGLFIDATFEVPIYKPAPLKAIAVQPPNLAKPAISAASSLVKVRRTP